jgi:hypothetical protein
MAVAAAVVIVVMMAAIVVVMMVIVAAVVMTAIMVMVMMAAAGVGIEVQFPCQKCRHCLIGITADTAVNSNIRLFQSDSCTTADATADQGIDTLLFQKACQRTVAASVGINHRTGYHSTVFYLENLEACAVSEMLEYLTVFISYCNFHCNLSF